MKDEAFMSDGVKCFLYIKEAGSGRDVFVIVCFKDKEAVGSTMATLISKLEMWYDIVVGAVGYDDGCSVKESNWSVIVRVNGGILFPKNGDDVGVFPGSGEMGC